MGEFDGEKLELLIPIFFQHGFVFHVWAKPYLRQWKIERKKAQLKTQNHEQIQENGSDALLDSFGSILLCPQ